MKEVKIGREKEVADDRMSLGDERLLAFLRACSIDNGGLDTLFISEILAKCSGTISIG